MILSITLSTTAAVIVIVPITADLIIFTIAIGRSSIILINVIIVETNVLGHIA